MRNVQRSLPLRIVFSIRTSKWLSGSSCDKIYRMLCREHSHCCGWFLSPHLTLGHVHVPFRIDPVKIPFILGIYLLMYLENMIFYTFDCFFSIAHTIHIVFIVFWSSSRKRAACPPSICTWWNWKEMGKVVLNQHLR